MSLSVCVHLPVIDIKSIKTSRRLLPLNFKISFCSFAKLGKSAPFRDSASAALGCFRRLCSQLVEWERGQLPAAKETKRLSDSSVSNPSDLVRGFCKWKYIKNIYVKRDLSIVFLTTSPFVLLKLWSYNYCWPNEIPVSQPVTPAFF